MTSPRRQIPTDQQAIGSSQTTIEFALLRETLQRRNQVIRHQAALRLDEGAASTGSRICSARKRVLLQTLLLADFPYD
jgi:hypothetical protein